MTVTLELSEAAARLLEKKGREGFVLQALLRELLEELESYEREDRRLSLKYRATFSEFKEGIEKGSIRITEDWEDADKWHVEWRDYMKWTALQDAMKQVREEIGVVKSGK